MNTWSKRTNRVSSGELVHRGPPITGISRTGTSRELQFLGETVDRLEISDSGPERRAGRINYETQLIKLRATGAEIVDIQQWPPLHQPRNHRRPKFAVGARLRTPHRGSALLHCPSWVHCIAVLRSFIRATLEFRGKMLLQQRVHACTRCFGDTARVIIFFILAFVCVSSPEEDVVPIFADKRQTCRS